QQRDAQRPQAHHCDGGHQVAGEVGEGLGHICAQVVDGSAQNGEDVALSVVVQPGVGLPDAADIAGPQHTDAHHSGDNAQNVQGGCGGIYSAVNGIADVVEHAAAVQVDHFLLSDGGEMFGITNGVFHR